MQNYRITGKKSLERTEHSANHLKKHFEGVRAHQITTTLIKQYNQVRQEAGAKNSKTNRELAVLKRMFNLGRLETTPPKVNKTPYIPGLKRK